MNQERRIQKATCNTVLIAVDDFGEEVLTEFVEVCRPQIGKAKYIGFNVLINQALTRLQYPVSDYGFVRLYNETRGMSLMNGIVGALHQQLLDYDGVDDNIGGYRLIGIGRGESKNSGSIGTFHTIVSQFSTLLKKASESHWDKSEKSSSSEELSDLSMGNLSIEIQERLTQLMSNLRKSKHDDKPEAFFISLNESETEARREWKDFIRFKSPNKSLPFKAFSLTGDKGSYQLKEDDRKLEAALLLKILTFEVGGSVGRTDKDYSYDREQVAKFFDNHDAKVHHLDLKSVIDGQKQAKIQGGLSAAFFRAKKFLTFKKEGEPSHITPDKLEPDQITQATECWNNRFNIQNQQADEDNDKPIIDLSEYFKQREILAANIEETTRYLAEDTGYFENSEDLFDPNWLQNILALTNSKVRSFIGRGDELSYKVITNLSKQYKKYEIQDDYSLDSANQKSWHSRYDLLGGKLFKEKLRKHSANLAYQLTLADQKKQSIPTHKRKQVDADTYQLNQSYKNLDPDAIERFKSLHRHYLELEGPSNRSLWSQKLLLGLSVLASTLMISSLSENIDIPPQPKASAQTLTGLVDWVLYYVIQASYYVFNNYPLLSSILFCLLIILVVHQFKSKKNDEIQIEYQSRLGRLRYAVSDLVKTSIPVIEASHSYESSCSQYVIGKAHNYQRTLDRYQARVDGSLRCIDYLIKRLKSEQEALAKQVDNEYSQDGNDDRWRLAHRLINFDKSRIERVLSPPPQKTLDHNDDKKEFSKHSPWKDVHPIDDVDESQDFFLFEDKFIKKLRGDNPDEIDPPSAEDYEKLQKDLKEFLKDSEDSQHHIERLYLLGDQVGEIVDKIFKKEHLTLGQNKYTANDESLFAYIIKKQLLN